MNNDVEQRLAQLLTGVDFNDISRNASIYWLKTPNSSEFEQRGRKGDAYFFGSTHEEDAQLLGSFGADGDELVLNSTLIVESCAYSALPYIDITGPTYLAFESEEDRELLRKDLQEFQKEGVLPGVFSHPAIVLELAGFDPGSVAVERFQVRDGRVEPLPIPGVVREIQREAPTLCKYLRSAVIMARLLNGSGQELRFDLPTGSKSSTLCGLLFARQGHEYRCMNMRTGKIFSLGREMYQAAMSVIGAETYNCSDGMTLDDETTNWALEVLQTAVDS